MQRTYSFVLIAAALVGLAGCSKHGAPAAANATAPEPARVQTVRVETQPFAATLSITGTLVSRAVVELKAETTGRIVRYDKEEGAAVSAGEVLLYVDDERPKLGVREAASAVSVAEAARDRARVADTHYRAELERAQHLVASGGITDRDLKAARLAAQDARAQVALADAQLAQAQAALASANKRLADCQVHSPIAGVIYRKPVNKGAYVEPATAVVTLVDNARLELESQIPASELGGVRVGQTVNFTVNSYPGDRFHGRVTELSPAVDTDSRTAKVRIQVVNNGKLKAGMFAQGEIATGAARQAILVPLAAVYRDDTASKVSHVFVIANGKALRRQVKIGHEVDQRLEIVEGLQAGDLLVPERSVELADGVPVKQN